MHSYDHVSYAENIYGNSKLYMIMVKDQPSHYYHYTVEALA